MNVTRKLFNIFGSREKKKLTLLFFLMIIAALFETVGIGLIAPFVSIVTDLNNIHKNQIFSYLHDFFGIRSTTTFVVVVTTILVLIFIVKNLYLMGFYWIQYRIIYNEQVKMSKRLFNVYLSKPYTFHLKRNSAELLRNTNIEVQRVFKELIVPYFSILTELLIMISVVILLLVMAPLATALTGAILGSSIVLFFKLFRKKLSKMAKAQQIAQGEMIKWVNQGLGAIKEVKVTGRENFFVDAYAEVSKKFANTRWFYETIRQVPRLFVETIVVVIILLNILVIMLTTSDVTALLTTISLFTMAAFRLMPSITRLVSAQTSIRNTLPALDILYNDLKEDERLSFLSTEKKIEISKSVEGDYFRDSIVVNNVSFRYPGTSKNIIQDVSFKIPINKSVAFVGSSGSGKTTMIDLILGVFEPSVGTITVDGHDIRSISTVWKQRIGYIPQFIYLSDDTIRNNIAFGLKSTAIDDNAIWRALQQAQLDVFVKNLPNMLDTIVGERGVRLSGGQRQRIGIARALYNDPEILFMDEATSALDNDTEREIMNSIDGLKGKKTIIIVAHRLSTIKNCDIIYRMENGTLVSQEHRTFKESV